uniref:RING-type domain-containing protein n=1 Tax=Opuntia streptacantha TaxID=393608 RepID=A0A7C9DJ44_OPUST
MISQNQSQFISVSSSFLSLPSPMSTLGNIPFDFDLDEALTMPSLISIKSSSEGLTTAPSNCSETLATVDVPPTAARRDDQNKVCTICLDEFEPVNVGKQLSCGHVYHLNCIQTWISICNTCPVCRDNIIHD